MRKAATVFLFAGFIVAVPGMLLRVMHWPWATPIQFLAGILIIIGVILIFISLIGQNKHQR